MNEWEHAGRILQAAGAGLGGRGEEWRRTQLLEKEQLREQEDRQKKAEWDRMVTQYTDSAAALKYAKAGRFDLAREIGANRLQVSQQFPGVDFSDTQRLTQLADEAGRGDAQAGQALIAELERNVAIGSSIPEVRKMMDIGGDKYLGTKGNQALYEGPNGPYTKQIAGLATGPSEKERAETERIRADTEKIRTEQQRIAAEIKGLPKEEAELVKTERVETLKNNTKRIALLSTGSKSRSHSITKARRFLRAFERGEAESGTTRTVAGVFPGVWTDQGRFDEELDSFAEIAAREKLKAVGEVRPTDADVEGMKRALFGKSRDEETNIKLLTSFIDEMDGLDDELESLLAAKSEKRLSAFTYTADDSGGMYVDSSGQSFTQEDVMHTAEKHGVSVEEVIKRAGLTPS